MHLILIRHAKRENLPGVADNAQVLTPEGCEAAKMLGEYLASKELPEASTIFFSSDYARALQTAQIINEALGNKYSIQTKACLRPEAEGSVAEILELIKASKQHKYVVLVGHQPELEQIGLVFCEKLITFKKGEAVCIKVDDDWNGKVKWRFVPK